MRSRGNRKDRCDLLLLVGSDGEYTVDVIDHDTSDQQTAWCIGMTAAITLLLHDGPAARLYKEMSE